MNILIENHIFLAMHIAKKRHQTLPRRITYDEIYSAGLMGLTEAASRFKPEMGYKFSTYAYRRIDGAIGDYLREIRCREISLDNIDIAA